MANEIVSVENLLHKQNEKNVAATVQTSDSNRVGMSIFYGDLSPEKQDFMKPEQTDTDEEST